MTVWRPLIIRIVVAVVGGYALAALASVAALALPISRPQAVLTGMLASFAVYAGAVVWVFAAHTGRGIRQTMSDLHTWAGLLAGWILYAMFLTGTVSYFKDEISEWMRPELPHLARVPDQAAAAQRIVAELAVMAPGSTQWSMELPTDRGNVASAFWRVQGAEAGRRAFQSATFDPLTGHVIAARDTRGGEFFYRFHFQFHYMSALWGRWLAGLCAMFMLVAIVSGVITHKKIFVDFFTFRWGKGQRSWLDAHNALSVFGLPFHLMITYSGLVTLMAMYMPWGQQVALKTPAQQQEFRAQLNAFIQPGKPGGQQAALAPIDDMVRQAQARWGRDNVGRVTITLPGDAAARVAVTRGEAARPSISPQYMLFEGATGKLLEVHDSVGPAAEVRGVMFALHVGRFSDLPMRWLYFIVSLAGTAMVGTGLVMWTVKRRQRLADPERPESASLMGSKPACRRGVGALFVAGPPQDKNAPLGGSKPACRRGVGANPFGFRVVERLNIAAIAGLSVAMTVFLWGNRLLPVDLAARGSREIDLFFAVWAATLLYALIRPARRAWIELLWLAAGLLALLPVLNAATTHRPLWHSVATGDWVYAGFDLMMWAFAALHAALALRAMRHANTRARRPHPGAGTAASDYAADDAWPITSDMQPAADANGPVAASVGKQIP